MDADQVNEMGAKQQQAAWTAQERVGRLAEELFARAIDRSPEATPDEVSELIGQSIDRSLAFASQMYGVVGQRANPGRPVTSQANQDASGSGALDNG